jgi:glyoxylase-like metal-dependent hydrolase (beta-lactamase superfamily II)
MAPQVAQVVPGLHRVPTYANAYVVTEQRLAVIDASGEPVPQRLFDLLDRLKVGPRDLTSIIITHTHPDHVTGLAALKARFPDARVAAHEVEAPFVAKDRVYDGPPGPHVQRHTGVPVDVRLRDGEAFEGFRVLHTPGHTWGSISLFDDAAKLLLAGDAVRTEEGLAPMQDQFNVDPAAHRASIRRLAQLDVETLVCGHGDPLVGGAGKALRDLAARL